MTRGGKREGAGRPAGSGKGRTLKTCSVGLLPAELARWDAACTRLQATRRAALVAALDALESAHENRPKSTTRGDGNGS